MSTHTFIHTFGENGIVVLRVDLSKNPPSMVQIPREVPEAQQAEYREWVNHTVAPQIVALCSVEQKMACAKKGLEMLS